MKRPQPGRCDTHPTAQSHCWRMILASRGKKNGQNQNGPMSRFWELGWRRVGERKGLTGGGLGAPPSLPGVALGQFLQHPGPPAGPVGATALCSPLKNAQLAYTGHSFHPLLLASPHVGFSMKFQARREVIKKAFTCSGSTGIRTGG